MAGLRNVPAMAGFEVEVRAFQLHVKSLDLVIMRKLENETFLCMLFIT